jgi:hypothetical protein
VGTSIAMARFVEEEEEGGVLDVALVVVVGDLVVTQIIFFCEFFLLRVFCFFVVTLDSF